jgi:hypothetical protein
MNKTISALGAASLLLGGGTVAVDRLQNPYLDRSDHYEFSVAADIPQGDHVEVAKAAPQVTLSRWNDEERITITPNLPGVGKASAASRPLLSKRMEFSKAGVTAFVEPAATSSGFDIDFTLDSRPASNVFTYTVTSADDLAFFYQPALTDDEIANGDNRPDNVVGSYAVYSTTRYGHVEGKTNYGTGKLFHIYRPKAVDADGNEIWADLSYDSGVLSVTVPQKFLETATYPVVVDPTFGYTTTGASTGASFSNFLLAAALTNYSPASDGTIASMTVRLNSSGGTARMTAYNNGTNAPAAYTSTFTPIVGDNTAAISTGGPVLASGAYALAVTTSNSNTVFFDSVGGGTANYRFAAHTPTNAPPNPVSWSTTGSGGNRQLTIYATYTASGGAVPNGGAVFFE